MIGRRDLERLFPTLDTLAKVHRVARRASIAGLVFAAMCALGFAFLLFTGDVPGHDVPFTGRARILGLIAGGLEFGAILFLSWRVSTAKGYRSSVALLTLFVIETGENLARNDTNVAWIVVYSVLALLLLNGARACFSYKRISSEAITDAF